MDINDGRYDDIINLPRHVSQTRARLPANTRAAQFLPFAALAGYDDAIRESSRVTQEKREPSDSDLTLLNEKFLILAKRVCEQPNLTITYFKPDDRKFGGSYATVSGKVRKFREYERTIVMLDGAEILIDDILDMDGELFSGIY